MNFGSGHSSYKKHQPEENIEHNEETFYACGTWETLLPPHIFKNPILYFHIGFLPLAFSRQPLWSWPSMIPVPHIPVICSQLESSCPQTSAHSSNTLSAEPHNPGLRTSPLACWCRCLAPSAAAEPVDLPWMSSSAKECKNTTWGETSLCPSLV